MLEKLFLAFSSLGNWQEAEAFLSEFLTQQEIVMMAKRLEVYKRVEGKEKYERIMRDVNVTAQTVRDARKKMERADVFFLRVIRKFKLLDKRLK